MIGTGEALSILLSRFHVSAKAVHVDYDPAGSSTSYVPEPRDVAVLAAFLGRTPKEDEFFFMIGCGPTQTHYVISAKLIEECVAAVQSRVLPREDESSAQGQPALAATGYPMAHGDGSGEVR